MRKIIKIEKLEKTHKSEKFTGIFSTNAIGAEMHLERPQRCPPTEEQRSEATKKKTCTTRNVF